MDWILLTKSDQVNELTEISKTQPVLIFKHSPRCFISKFALKNFNQAFDNPTQIPTYMVDVVDNRVESMGIAQKFDVQHQSPQILLVVDQKVVYTASHESIDAQELTKHLLRL